MRFARILLLFGGTALATIILLRPAAWRSQRHVDSDEPELLTEAAVSALSVMRRPFLSEPLSDTERKAAERFYELHNRLLAMGPRATPSMLTLFGHASWNVRIWAAFVVSQAGPSAIPDLIGLLNRENPRVRVDAIAALAGSGLDPRIMPIVAEYLDDPEYSVASAAKGYFRTRRSRYVAGRTYTFARADWAHRGVQSRESVVQFLCGLLSRVADDDRMAIVSAILRCDTDSAASPLIDAFLLETRVTPASLLRWYIADALGSLDHTGASLPATQPQIEQLLEVSNSEDMDVRLTAILILSHLSDGAAAERVTHALADEHDLVRSAIAARLHRQSRLTDPQLLALLDDESIPVLKVALRIIEEGEWAPAYDRVLARTGFLGDADALLWPMLFKLDPARTEPHLSRIGRDKRADPHLRVYAAGRLSDVPLLKLLAKDPEPPVRLSAMNRLVELNAPGVLEMLVDRAENDPYLSECGSYTIRAAALYLMGRVKAVEELPRLVSIVQNTMPNESGSVSLGEEAAVVAVGLIGNPAAIDSLRSISGKGLGYGYTLHQALVVRARARLCDSEAASGLESMLMDRMDWSLAFSAKSAPAVTTFNGWSQISSDPEYIRDILDARLRDSAELFTALGETGISRLLDMLKLPDEEIHPYVLLGLARSRDPRAWGPLVSGLKSGHHLLLRRAAAEGLGLYGDTGAVPLLVQASGDPSPWVCAASVISLQVLTGSDFGIPEPIGEAFDQELRPRFDPAALHEAVVAWDSKRTP